MKIRRATRGDMEQLVALRFDFLAEFRHIDEVTRGVIEPQLRDYFARHLGKDDFVALLGEEDGRAVSCAFFTVSESPPNDQYPNGWIAYVFNVYTLPAYRGRRCAEKVMAHLVEQAKALGVTAINLNASEAGKGIYQRLGFHVLSDTAMRLQLYRREP